LLRVTGRASCEFNLTPGDARQSLLTIFMRRGVACSLTRAGIAGKSLQEIKGLEVEVLGSAVSDRPRLSGES
jgi:hypothetical protein